MILKVVLAAAIISLSFPIQAKEPELSTEHLEVIFEVDDIIPAPNQSSNQAIDNNINAVGTFFKKHQLKEIAGEYELDNIKTLEERLGTCTGEKYANEPAIGNCTGFFIGGNTILTAGHCVGSNYEYFAFDYNTDSNGVVDILKQVYKVEGLGPSKIPGGRDILDYAVVYLKTPVTGIEPVSISTTKKISLDERVYTVGHPSGLPKKTSGLKDPANVKRNTDEHFFYATLDIHTGNSGSPVFNYTTHEVEGILVSGHSHEVITNPNGQSNCAKTLQCDKNGNEPGCDLTKIQRITSVPL